MKGLKCSELVLSLPHTLFAVFIDAYHAKMRDDDVAAGGVGRIKDVTIFTALGIDTEGHKSILGFWVNEGDENKALWADVFQDMVTRGLKRVLVFVTDDFPGVKEIIKKLYPFAIISSALFTCKETSGSTFQRKYIRR